MTGEERKRLERRFEALEDYVRDARWWALGGEPGPDLEYAKRLLMQVHAGTEHLHDVIVAVENARHKRATAD